VTAQPAPAGAARAQQLGAAYFRKDESLAARVLAALQTLLPDSVEHTP
jgi:hypothetical protein